MKQKTNIVIGLILLSVGFLVGFFTHILLTSAPKSDIDIYSMLDTYPEETPDPSYQSEDKALKLVRELQEVKDFKKRIEAIGKSKPIVAIDNRPNPKNSYYVVQVYEEVPDNDDSYHTATFGWYRVDPKTWIVMKREMSEYDKWDIINTE